MSISEKKRFSGILVADIILCFAALALLLQSLCTRDWSRTNCFFDLFYLDSGRTLPALLFLCSSIVSVLRETTSVGRQDLLATSGQILLFGLGFFIAAVGTGVTVLFHLSHVGNLGGASFVSPVFAWISIAVGAVGICLTGIPFARKKTEWEGVPAWYSVFTLVLAIVVSFVIIDEILSLFV